MSNNLHIIQHPLIEHKLSLLRDKKTPSQLFRTLISEITFLLFYEATRNLPTNPAEVETPLEKTKVETLGKTAPIIIPILRAGLGMVDAALTLMPFAKVGHIGLVRNETTLMSECYYFKIPEDSAQYPVFVCDPMLATGGSTTTAIEMLHQHGIQNITLVSILAAPEGIAHFQKKYPKIPVYVAHLDRQLNERGYILPGLGDAGDRIFGTFN